MATQSMLYLSINIPTSVCRNGGSVQCPAETPLAAARMVMKRGMMCPQYFLTVIFCQHGDLESYMSSLYEAECTHTIEFVFAVVPAVPCDF